MSSPELLDKAIRRIPDFPKPGVLFYDITGVLVAPDVFRYCVDELCAVCRRDEIDAIAGIESRGFVFSAPVAEKLGIPLILIRKKGKLPGKTLSCSYALEYGTAEIEVHCDDITCGQRVLVIDDLIATGGTLKAARTVLEQGGAEVIGYAGVIGLPFLQYEQVLSPLPVTTLIAYEGE